MVLPKLVFRPRFLFSVGDGPFNGKKPHGCGPLAVQILGEAFYSYNYSVLVFGGERVNATETI